MPADMVIAFDLVTRDIGQCVVAVTCSRGPGVRGCHQQCPLVLCEARANHRDTVSEEPDHRR
jgi:hypothetical protein